MIYPRFLFRKCVACTSLKVYSANILGIRYSVHKVICGLVFFGSRQVPRRSAMVGAEQAVVVRAAEEISHPLGDRALDHATRPVSTLYSLRGIPGAPLCGS